MLFIHVAIIIHCVQIEVMQKFKLLSVQYNSRKKFILTTLITI